ncbi:energy transducer TonB [Paraburkholderia sp. SG-MS1]|uniref:energy transducer TonB n=1 Tax=Paraburkholderia sp. SG-MS1 TaxID=2023741 RepID=UPI00237BD44E|nr:TonB family protein [Paraburkholderia sp. SG-MS1]
MRSRRGVIVLGAVIGAHVLLLYLAASTRDRMVERPIEPVTITAMLLSPPAEPAKPAAPVAVPPAAPSAARPAVRAKPLPQVPLQPQARSRASRSAAATPAPVAPVAPRAPLAPTDDAAPSATAQPAPAVPTPSPATAPANGSAPATDPTLAESATPKNVAHIDCAIPKPDYPDISMRRGENGTAIVRFVVGLTGRIETTQLQRSSGYPRLDEAALAAVHASACQPYRENGAAVRAAYSQSFVFGLTE